MTEPAAEIPGKKSLWYTWWCTRAYVGENGCRENGRKMEKRGRWGVQKHFHTMWVPLPTDVRSCTTLGKTHGPAQFQILSLVHLLILLLATEGTIA